MIVELGTRELRTKFGTFAEHLFYDGQCESIALVMGAVDGIDEVLCRIHSHCIGAHVFNSIERECREEMEAAQRMIQEAGRGMIIWLDQEGKGNGHLALIESMKYKEEFGQAEAYVRAGYARDARDYWPAAAIIEHFGIKSITLMSGSNSKADELRKLGTKVARLQFKKLTDL